MSDPVLYHVFFGLVAAVGAWLVTEALLGGGPVEKASRWWRGWRGRKRTPLEVDLEAAHPPEADPTTRAPLSQRLISGPLADLGWVLFRHQDHAGVEERLRRSGWRYRSVGDYYGNKVANAIAYFVVSAVSAAVLGLPAWLICVVAVGVGALGLYRPDEKVAETLKLRRENLFREMAWTLDRIAMVMQSGASLQPALNALTRAGVDAAGAELAWVGGGSGGLFIALLRDLAGGLTAGRKDVETMVDELRQRLPDELPELDEFMELVKADVLKKRDGALSAQLRLLAQGMRDQLNHRIEELAQKAELKVVLITSGVIVPTLLVVIGGAALLGFKDLF